MLKFYVETSRPKTLIASFAPIALIGAFHFKAMMENLFLFTFILLSSLVIQMLTNYFNDYYDFAQGQDTDLRLGPKRPFQRNDLSKKKMQKGILLLSCSYFGFTLPLIQRIGVYGIILSIVCYFLSIYYTKGNYSLSKLGISDIFSFVFFGPLATSITGYALECQWQLVDFLIGILPGSFSTILLIVNHLRDEKEDRINKKTTSVVRFGSEFGKRLIYFFVSLFLINFFLIFPLNFFSIVIFFISFLSAIKFIQLFRSSCKEDAYQHLLPIAAFHFMVQFLLHLFLICILNI